MHVLPIYISEAGGRGARPAVARRVESEVDAGEAAGRFRSEHGALAGAYRPLLPIRAALVERVADVLRFVAEDSSQGVPFPPSSP
ncbi:hypothetical protein J19TS2_39770 [Cohnella xylanilytica]|nr:hypothetical protein J19TS2_39770 [Cohnella xylanilytica]